jgi:hypothetical protein
VLINRGLHHAKLLSYSRSMIIGISIRGMTPLRFATRFLGLKSCIAMGIAERRSEEDLLPVSETNKHYQCIVCTSTVRTHGLAGEVGIIRRYSGDGSRARLENNLRP